MEKTPKKSPQKRKLQTPGSSRKKKSKVETIGEKSLQFFNNKEPVKRMENGVLKDYYECKECKKQICGTTLSNLGSHLYTSHPEIYRKHIGKVKESIPIQRLRLLQNCVSIIALGGRPITFLSDIGFQNIIAGKLKKFQAAGCSLDLKSSHQPEVHRHLSETAQKVREAIKKEVKNRPVSILLDVGNRHDRAMLGISVQFIVNSRVNVRSIGVIELTQRHTAANLAEVVKRCLKEYGITKRQIISITSDNGANVLKMIKDLQEILSNDLVNKPTVVTRLNFDDSSANDESIDNEIAIVLNRGEVNDDEEALELIVGEANEIDPDLLRRQQNLLCDTVNDLMTENDIDNQFEVAGINCSAHTLQLAIHDALNALPDNVKRVLSLCRRVVKILRLKATTYELKSADIAYNIPHLEVPTRWGSLFKMLSDLMRCYDAIKHFEKSQKYDEFGVLLKTWPILKELVRILSIPYKTTIELQRRDLTLSDSYVSWTTMELHLKSKAKQHTKSGLIEKLLSAIDRRKETVFLKPLMKAAIFLDPRVRCKVISSREDTEEAKKVLSDLSNRLALLNETRIVDDLNQSTETVNISDENFDPQKAFDESCSSTSNTQTTNNQCDLEIILDLFDPPQLPLSASILEYWDSKRNEEDFQILYNLAMAIFAVPPTEVDIERDFSALKFILTDLRHNLSTETLADILTINLNKPLYLEINENELRALEKSHPSPKDI